jgi:hypothetical protein
VLSLFQLPCVKALGASRRWLPVRLVFSLLVDSNRHNEGAAHDGDHDQSVVKSKLE